MDKATVFTKTAKGITQVNQRSASLSKDLMKVLKLIDGKSNFGQLLEKAELDKGVLEKALNTLTKDGFARIFETKKEEADPFAEAEDEFDFTAPKKGSPAATQRVIPGAANDISELVRQQKKAEEDRKLKEAAHEQARLQAKAQAEARARVEAEAKARQQAEQAAMEQAKRAKEASERARAELESKMREEEARKQAINAQQAKLTEAQKAKEEEEGRRLAELRVKAEREAKALAEARARAEAEAAAMAKARAEAEAAVKKQAAEASQAEAAMKARLKDEIESRIRHEMEDLLRNEVEEKTRAEMKDSIMAEAKLAAKAELEERLREEREVIAKAEQEERGKAEKEANARASEEAKKRAEAEARANTEAEARIRAEEETKKLRAQAEEQARKAKELEIKAREAVVAAEARAKQEAEARARDAVQAAEARAKAESERARQESERARQEADRAKQESEARAKALAEADERVKAERQAKYEAEARAKIDAEERDKRERAMAATLEAERKAKEDAEQRARMEVKARETLEVDTRAKVQAELETDMAKRAEIEGKAQAKAFMEAKVKAEADEDARLRSEQAKRAREIADVLRTKVEPDAIAPDPGSAAGKRRSYKRRGNLARNTAFSLVGGLVVAVIAVHVVPMRGLAVKVERAMSAWLHDDVSIAATTFRLIPSPHLRVENLSVGKALDAKATTGRIFLDLGSIMSDKLSISSVELDGVSISSEAVKRILPLWAKAEGKAQSGITSIQLSGVKLEVKPVVEPFNANLQYSRDGTFRQATLNAGSSWSLSVKPGDKGMDLDFNARNWTLPLGAPIQVGDVRMKGVLAGSEIVVPEFEGVALDGAVNGTLKVSWGQNVRLESDLSIARVSSAMLVGAFTKNIAVTGRVEGNFNLVTEGPSVEAIFTSPRVQGKFKVGDGSISNVDLVAVMQSDSAGSRAGVTKFQELTGEFGSVNHGATFRQVNLQGGVLRGNGQLDVGNNSSLSGRVALEIRSQVAQDRGAFVVSGTVSRPIVRRGG